MPGLLGGGKQAAELLMDYASRMQRAKEMGFDVETRLFHGTGADVKEFDPLKMGRSDEGWFSKGFYTTPDPKFANQFANVGTPNVLPLYARTPNQYDWRANDGAGMRLGTLEERYNKTRELRDAGFSGVDVFNDTIKLPANEGLSDEAWGALVRHSMDTGTPLLPREMVEKSLRSGVRVDDFARYYGDSLLAEMPIERQLSERVVFAPEQLRSINAAFDPAKRDSPDLLAGIGGAAVLGGGLLGSGEAEAGPLAAGMRRMIDPGFAQPVGSGNPRVKTIPKMETMQTDITPRSMNYGDDIDLRQHEGTPYLLTQSDRSAAGGVLTGVHGTDIDPVNLPGGRDFMFDSPNEGMVWASAPGVVTGMRRQAEALKARTGKDPLLMPYTMAPTGIDFASMPLDVMVNYARASMSKKNKAKMNTGIKKILPDWKGIDDPSANALFREAGPKRKKIADFIDKNFKEVPGGMSMSEARAATTASDQYRTPTGQIVNVGRVDTSSPNIADSGHPTYIAGLPGEGLGRLTQPLDAMRFMEHAGRSPSGDMAQDYYSLKMIDGLREGVIDDKFLRKMYGNVNPAILPAVAAGAAGAQEAQQPGLLGRAYNAAGNAAGTLLQAPDTIMQGLLGIANLPRGLDAAAAAARTPYEEQLKELGGYVTDRTGSPMLGTAAYTLPQFLSPF